MSMPSDTSSILPLLFLGGVKSWEMPQLPSLNKLPPRATLIPYPTAEAARTLEREASPWFISLDGQWDFKIKSRPEEVTWAVEDPRQGTVAGDDWATIQVPGNWTMQGFGRPHYTNVQMPWPNVPPDVPDDNPTGIYRRTFILSESWRGRRVVLHFGGCEGALYVYVNGRPVGISKDARTPAEFDISGLVRPGEPNELLAIVTQWSDASFLEDQDHWWQAGLQREVYLYSTGSPHIQDVFARGDLSDDLQDGILRVTVKIGFPGETHENWVVEARLFDPEGQAVFPQPLVISAETLRLGDPRQREQASSTATAVGRTEIQFEQPVPAPRLWSAETPHLYTLVVSLKLPSPASGGGAGGGGKFPEVRGGEESVRCTVGFRKIEIRDRNLLINGKRVLIKGVNLHDHHETMGKAIPRETMEADVRLMKQFNVNAVRTSHYPKDDYYYELFDRYGIYVVDEANIETHAFYRELCRDPRYTNAFVERVRGMVERDKNHPCVIFWSLGNESGYGPNHDAAAGYVRGADPSRPLHYEGAIGWASSHNWDGGERATDVICPMYPQIASIIAWSQAGKGHRPLIMCEYSHCMGNSNGSLADYFAAFEKYPGLQGGYLWEWLDHGIRQTAADGTVYWAYGGDFGDEPNDANFVTDGIVWPNRTPHPGLFEFKKLAQPVRVEPVDPSASSGQALATGKVRTGKCTVCIINKHDFIGLDWLRGEWELTEDGVRVASGELPALTIGPGEAMGLELKFQADTGSPLKRTGERFLNFRFYQKEASLWAPDNPLTGICDYEVAWEQIALQPSEPKATAVPKEEATAPVVASEDAQTITLRAGDVRAVFDKTTGTLTEFGAGRANVIERGPQLNVWRGATDNDGIKLMLNRDEWQRSKPLGRWLAVGLDKVMHTLDAIRLTLGPVSDRAGLPTVEIVSHASGRGRLSDFEHVHRYTLLPSGELEVENVVKIGNGITDVPRVGVSLTLVPGLENLEWFGRGPWENYSDRKASAMVGRYQSTVSDQYVPYIMPQEHGHKTDVRWLTLTNVRGRGLKVIGQPTLEFSASHFSDDDLFRARHTIDLRPRPEVILNLDAAHRGLGTASCGPDTLEQYRLLAPEYRFTYRLAVI